MKLRSSAVCGIGGLLYDALFPTVLHKNEKGLTGSESLFSSAPSTLCLKSSEAVGRIDFFCEDFCAEVKTLVDAACLAMGSALCCHEVCHEVCSGCNAALIINYFARFPFWALSSPVETTRFPSWVSACQGASGSDKLSAVGFFFFLKKKNLSSSRLSCVRRKTQTIIQHV